MQIVITMDEETYKHTMEMQFYIPGNISCKGILWKILYSIRTGISLPKGHGRLIDADAIPEQIELKGFLEQDNAHLVTIDRVKEALNNATTIIEADAAEREEV